VTVTAVIPLPDPPATATSGPVMDADARAVVDKLNRLAFELVEREKLVKRRLGYYTGDHPLKYASAEFAGYFGARFRGFNDNWVAPVVNAPSERMNPLGVRLDGDDSSAPDAARPSSRQRGVDPELERVWRANDCDAGASEAFVLSLAAGRSFATVWGNPDDETTPVVTFERPDQAIIEYGDRGQRVAAMRLWRDDKLEYTVLDDGEYLWKFQRQAALRDGRLRSGLVVPSMAPGGWVPRDVPGEPWPLPNPMGEVATVELANHSLLDRDNPLSDIDGVIAMQDAINLVWAYLMNALDYASLPQRVVTGAEIPKIPVLDENGQIVGHRPLELDTLIKERILWVPGQNAKIAEWSTASLDVFSQVIERAVEHIAAQTRTPPHYLIGKVANLSAEALTAAETGLVAKTRERTTYLSPGLRSVYRLIALAMDDEVKAKAVRAGTVVWDDFQYRALGQKVDALQKLATMGFPFEWIAEQYGLTPLEVERVVRMRDAEQPAGEPADGSAEQAPDPVDQMNTAMNFVGTGYRSGFVPKGLLKAVGLPDIEHTGLLPVTLRSAEKAEAGVPEPKPPVVVPPGAPMPGVGKPPPGLPAANPAAGGDAEPGDDSDEDEPTEGPPKPPPRR
jgi:Phage portal protein, SPP1 Gp6-like